MSFYTSVLYLFLQIVLTIAAPANVSASQVEPIIVDGTPVRIEQFPFFAAINSGGFCGGAIISETWILTAAHCVHQSSGIPVYVGGERVDNSQLYYSKRAIIHPRYTKGPTTYDIALVELPTPLIFSAKLQPARLPRSITSNPNLVFIGRGHDETGQLSVNLMKMGFLRMNPYDCMNAFTGLNEEPQLYEQSLFCGIRTDRDGPGVCDGDSGSPVLEQNTVIGVLSFYQHPRDVRHCKYSRYAGFTNVFYFKDWIASYTGLTY